ncbi:MAG TPA: hypothetical protein PLZ93_06920 [Nocardioides sp.]|nr:hypothetical protein [uncultured Nocardioides sp.]HRD60862.1 hypothetical protein [Nocardioides sp.]HRI95326.1 hypothetical protein [Nocardioides sp.]HRK47148.1 hypothetical protein [Nocardioides sp.]
MSAQLYLSRLIDEGRTDRGVHRGSLRTGGLTRQERRLRRAAEDRKH